MDSGGVCHGCVSFGNECFAGEWRELGLDRVVEITEGRGASKNDQGHTGSFD